MLSVSGRALSLHPDSELHAYVLGLAIGDGNLSNPNGRAVRLRITCDTKYPILIKWLQAVGVLTASVIEL
jgi:hypothetical protein